MNRYQALHRALRKERGSAVGRPCAAPDCKRLADGWGLIGEASHYDMDGCARVRYSTHLGDYTPLCYSHNAQLDKGGDWTYCPNGHHRATWGKSGTGCRGCARESARAGSARREA